MKKVMTAEVIIMVLCFMLAWDQKSQELYTLGEFVLLLFIVTCGVAMNKYDKNRDE